MNKLTQFKTGDIIQNIYLDHIKAIYQHKYTSEWYNNFYKLYNTILNEEL